MKRTATVGVVLGLAVAGLSITLAMTGLPGSGQTRQQQTGSAAPLAAAGEAPTTDIGRGLVATDQAAQAKKYLFAFFWKTESAETTTMRAVFEAALNKLVDRAQAVEICISEPSEKGIVEKFGLDRAPMPLVLAIAPNGAILGGFPQKFTEDDLLNAFGSPCTEQCMKVLQDGNLVLLCVQNKGTASNEEALHGVRDFAADPRYASATRIVMLDPADATEKPFLADLKIDPETAEAVTAFLVPPGSVIAEFKGATTKDELISVLNKANTGCGPGGCGPGGCGPRQ